MIQHVRAIIKICSARPPPEDILGRALTGNLGREDEGIESTTERGEVGATLIDCGVRPGYFTDRLGAIADLATEPQRRGLLVAWS